MRCKEAKAENLSKSVSISNISMDKSIVLAYIEPNVKLGDASALKNLFLRKVYEWVHMWVRRCDANDRVLNGIFVFSNMLLLFELHLKYSITKECC